MATGYVKNVGDRRTGTGGFTVIEDRDNGAGRTSPPTERVMAVLDFLAQHRTERFDCPNWRVDWA